MAPDFHHQRYPATMSSTLINLEKYTGVLEKYTAVARL